MSRSSCQRLRRATLIALVDGTIHGERLLAIQAAASGKSLFSAAFE